MVRVYLLLVLVWCLCRLDPCVARFKEFTIFDEYEDRGCRVTKSGVEFAADITL